MKRLLWLLLVISFLLPIAGSAQFNGCSAGFCAPPQTGGGGTSLSVDGNGVTGTPTTGSNTAWALNALTTSLTNDIIYVFSSPGSGSNSLAGVSDVAGLTWHLRSNVGSSGCQSAWALAPSALSGDVITITYNAAETATVVGAIAIHGAHTAAPFDTNGSVPQRSGFGGTVSGISTNNANDILFGSYNNSGGLTASSPFTEIGTNANGVFATYDVVSATQSSVTIPYTGSTAFCGIGDAIIQGP